jgi:hypothetical protein
MIDAQTNPKLLAGIIASSPDVLIIIEARLSWLRVRHKRTQRLSARILGSVLFQHQFALQPEGVCPRPRRTKWHP